MKLSKEINELQLIPTTQCAIMHMGLNIHHAKIKKEVLVWGK
jgi:hypothetical protein